MTSKSEAREPIVRLLSLMRGGREIRQYLQRYATPGERSLTVVKVGGAVLRDDKAALADALAFLQSVGLSPVVVHGAGPQLDAEMSARGIPVERNEDGLRITPPEALAVVRDVMMATNLEIVEALREAGATVEPAPFGVIDAELVDEERLGMVGEACGVRMDRINSAVRAGAIPVLASLGADAQGRVLNVNADAAVRSLVHALKPDKIVFLTGAGGVLDADGNRLSSINLATDFDEMINSDWLSGGMRLKVAEIKRLLDDLPLTASVSITEPGELARELFTHGGSGTLVRLGEKLLVTADKSTLDRARVLALIEDAFGRPAAPDWWEKFELANAYVTERYRAGAFVSRLGDAGYLDKFAVLEEARGEGLGQAVWRRMVEDWPKIVWRSRPDNPITDFYNRNSDGSILRRDWVIYWRGVDDLTEIMSLVEAASSKPATMEEAAT